VKPLTHNGVPGRLKRRCAAADSSCCGARAAGADGQSSWPAPHRRRATTSRRHSNRLGGNAPIGWFRVRRIVALPSTQLSGANRAKPSTSRLHPLIPRDSKRVRRPLSAPVGPSSGAFGRLKHEAGIAPLRVRGIKKVQLHADLCILATLASARASAGHPALGVSLRATRHRDAGPGSRTLFA